MRFLLLTHFLLIVALAFFLGHSVGKFFQTLRDDNFCWSLPVYHSLDGRNRSLWSQGCRKSYFFKSQLCFLTGSYPIETSFGCYGLRILRFEGCPPKDRISSFPMKMRTLCRHPRAQTDIHIFGVHLRKIICSVFGLLTLSDFSVVYYDYN